MSKRAHEDTRQENDEATARTVQVFEGDENFKINDWKNWTEDDDWTTESFFSWKHIESPKTYFLTEFSLAFHAAILYYNRQAIIYGVKRDEFAAIILTVAHFVERAARNYPSNSILREERKLSTKREPTFDRTVPFGEIFYVLGSNAKDADYSSLLEGIVYNLQGRAFTEDKEIELPQSNFKAHSRFLILALSLLIDIGVLHVEVETSPKTRRYWNTPAVHYDLFTHYDVRVRGFQALQYRYNVPLSAVNYRFSPQVGSSVIAWEALLAHLRRSTGHSDTATTYIYRSRVNTEIAERLVAEQTNYDVQPYWCPAVNEII